MELQKDWLYLQGMQDLKQLIQQHRRLYQELLQEKYREDHLARQVLSNNYDPFL